MLIHLNTKANLVLFLIYSDNYNEKYAGFNNPLLLSEATNKYKKLLLRKWA